MKESEAKEIIEKALSQPKQSCFVQWPSLIGYAGVALALTASVWGYSTANATYLDAALCLKTLIAMSADCLGLSIADLTTDITFKLQKPLSGFNTNDKLAAIQMLLDRTDSSCDILKADV